MTLPFQCSYGNFLFLGPNQIVIPFSLILSPFLALQPHHYQLLIHHWTTETLVILTDVLEKCSTPVVALVKHNSTLAVRFKIIL